MQNKKQNKQTNNNGRLNFYPVEKFNIDIR